MRSRASVLAWSTALALAAALPLATLAAASPPPAAGDCGDALPADTSAIYRMPVSGTVTIKVGDLEEPIAVSGSTEMIEQNHDASKAQVALLALNGTSELLHGPITFTGSCRPGRASSGNLGTNSVLSVYLDVAAPDGSFSVEQPVRLKGSSAAPVKIGEQRLGDGTAIAVYHAAFNAAADGGQPIDDASGRQIGLVTRVNLTAERIAAHRPCCPLPGAKTETKKAGAEPETPAAGAAAPQGGH